MLQEMGVAELVISQAGFQTNLASKPKLWRQCVSLLTHVMVECPSADRIRWTPIICYHFIGAKGAAYIGSKDSTTRRDRMGRCDFRHVQLFAKRFPNQEWWLSILAAALLMRWHLRSATQWLQR